MTIAAHPIHYETVRDGHPITGHVLRVENRRVFVELHTSRSFGGWDPIADSYVLERGRAVFEQLADTWAWLLRTPTVLDEPPALEQELLSLSWYVGVEEYADRLGGCFGNDGAMLVPEEQWRAIQTAWDHVHDLSDAYKRDRVIAIATRLGCPHPERLWQAWDSLQYTQG